MGIDLQAFVQEVKGTLGEGLLGEKGGIFYNGAESLARGDIYVLGLNPGGDPTENEIRIGEDLEFLEKCPNRKWLWEDWGLDGRYKYQPRTQELLLKLADGCRDKACRICLVNLIFRQSPNAKDRSIWNNEEGCRYWKVHQLILKIVQPRLIVAIGNREGPSAFSFLRDKSRCSIERISYSPLGHNKRYRRYLKSFRDEDALTGHPVIVVGLPHFSWNPLSPTALDWISGKYSEARNLPGRS